MTEAPNATPARALMLGLGDEIFAIDAGMVREIIDPVPVTRVAGARADLAAVMNVRGNVIPLADLRIRFGMPHGAHGHETRIVVIELALDGAPVVVGVIADKVYEVAELMHAEEQPTPKVGLRWQPDYISCITKWNNEFVIVPNMARILG